MHTYNIIHLKLYIPQVQHSGFEQSEPDNEIDLQNVLMYFPACRCQRYEQLYIVDSLFSFGLIVKVKCIP